MDKRIKSILALLMALVLIMSFTACGDKDEEAAEPSGNQVEEVSGGEEEKEEAEEAVDDKGEVVKFIDDVDKDLGSRLPLQIASITLYDDGSVAIVPTDDLLKNEIKDDAEAVYPFEESGEVADIFVMDYGNAGYRTLIALMKDGTISAVNGRALVEDHIFAVMDTVANRDDFVSVESVKDESASGIVATTESGEEVQLDQSLNFDEPE